jgi:dihydropyrimidinase
MQSNNSNSNNNGSKSNNNSCDVLITNAAVVIPKVGIVRTDILIENGIIKDLRKSTGNTCASKKINANGKYILPGVIDPHVHYGVYTPINEAAQTESRSAAVGGVTTMIRMLRLYESYRNIEKHLRASKGTHHIDYSIHASILTSNQLKDISYLKSIGINSLKVYMNLGAELKHIFMDLQPGTCDITSGEVNMTDDLISSIIMEAATMGSTVLVHAEDPVVCSDHIRKRKETEEKEEKVNGLEVTTMNTSRLKIWSECRPPTSEAESISKAAEFANKFCSKLYFVHIGSSIALDAILAEKRKGNSNLFVETCPHYLTHTIDFDDLKGKVVPPLRSKSDVQYLWSALQCGIIDTIGTDHVANRLSMKVGQGDIWSALSGFPGVATMLPILLSRGVNENRITLEKVSEVTSYNTSRIFGLYPKKGTIQRGCDADLTIVDLDLEQRVTPELLQSYSDYTIYDGYNIKGWPVLTMVRGQVVMHDGQISSNTLGHGEFVARPVSDVENRDLITSSNNNDNK